jgi:hypothetical protein
MHHASRRTSVFRASLVASCLLLVGIAGSAFAQGPAPSCELTGLPDNLQVGQAFTLCGIDGAGLTYSWYDSDDNLLTHDRCLEFPNGLPAPGTYDFEFVISQGPDFLKCPFSITVREVPPPPQGACWLTGGGLKGHDAFGHEHSYGGNINPGCSPTAGDGGNWNDVNHTIGLHFQGRAIQVVRCGNVEGIPPGSESPVTPVNFIEFTGTGWVKGVQGNPTNIPNVYFWGHYEDREEPGSNGQPNLLYHDRYFLHVYTDPTDPAGSTVMLVDQDGDPNTVDPVIVDKGNLQMHYNPCEQKDVVVTGSLRPSIRTEGNTLPAELSFSATNPATQASVLRFSMPEDGVVSMKIFDVAGRQVADLGGGYVTAGVHSIDWDVRGIARGLYFARFAVNDQVRTRTIVVGN